MRFIRPLFVTIVVLATVIAGSVTFGSIRFDRVESDRAAERLAPQQKAETTKSPSITPTQARTDGQSKTSAEPAAGSSPDFYSPFEREIIGELNLARSNPKKYAEYLSDYRKMYNGKALFLPKRKPLITNEGLNAVDEALKFLNSVDPLPVYDISNGMSLAARDRLFDMRKTGVLGHRGSDGSLPDQRLERHGKWKSSVGEAIAYDVGSAREVVLGLIVDDGTSNRGHRKSIFSSSYRIIGIAAGESMKPNESCVIDFAGAFVETAPKVDTKVKSTEKPQKSVASK